MDPYYYSVPGGSTPTSISAELSRQPSTKAPPMPQHPPKVPQQQPQKVPSIPPIPQVPAKRPTSVHGSTTPNVAPSTPQMHPITKPPPPPLAQQPQPQPQSQTQPQSQSQPQPRVHTQPQQPINHGKPTLEKLAPGTQLTVGKHQVTIVKYLSEGGFAHIYVVKTNPMENGTEIACLKRVIVPNKEGLNQLRAEVEVMQRLANSDNIVRYYDSNASRMHNLPGCYEVLVLMELCPNKSLLDFMNSRLRTKLNVQEILKIMLDISKAVYNMHKLKLIHRDIKIENVLLDENFNFKLADFGSTCPILRVPRNQQEFQILHNDILMQTTPQYRCPEMIDLYRGLPIDEKSDIWALGVFLYKLCYYTTPFEIPGELAILHSAYSFPPQPVFPTSIKQLINIMLQENPIFRPNIYQVLKKVIKLGGFPDQEGYTDIYGLGEYKQPVKEQTYPAIEPFKPSVVPMFSPFKGLPIEAISPPSSVISNSSSVNMQQTQQVQQTQSVAQVPQIPQPSIIVNPTTQSLKSSKSVSTDTSTLDDFEEADPFAIRDKPTTTSSLKSIPRLVVDPLQSQTQLSTGGEISDVDPDGAETRFPDVDIESFLDSNEKNNTLNDTYDIDGSLLSVKSKRKGYSSNNPFPVVDPTKPQLTGGSVISFEDIKDDLIPIEGASTSSKLELKSNRRSVNSSSGRQLSTEQLSMDIVDLSDSD